MKELKLFGVRSGAIFMFYIGWRIHVNTDFFSWWTILEIVIYAIAWGLLDTAYEKEFMRKELINALEEACIGLEYEIDTNYSKADEEKLNEWRELLRQVKRTNRERSEQ